MLNYHEYQQTVYNWLLDKNNKDATFTFSTRVKGSQGAELNYFIGTEKSGYFGTTFWMIPVGFPGSSGDLIDVIFGYSENGLSYYIEFTQTKAPDPGQNTWALHFLETMKPAIKAILPLQYESAEKNKMYTYRIAPEKPEYTSIEDLLNDLDKQLKIVIPIVDNALLDEKKINPSFEGHRFTSDEFSNYQKRLIQRFERFSDLKIEFEEYVFNQVMSKSRFQNPINQILYGPPGTGKTYTAIDKVVQICELDEYREGEHEKNKLVYDRLVNDGRVIFTTFHQSMSYEDFIEGIKPVAPKNDSDPVQYKIEDGIFKLMCEQCLDEIRELKNQQFSTIPDLSFKEKYAEFVRQIQAGIIKLETRSGLPVRISMVSPSGNMRLITGDDTKDYIVSANRLERLLQEIPRPDIVTNIHEAVRNAIGGSHSSLYFASLMAFKEFEEKYTKTIAEEGKQIDLVDIRLSNQEIQSLPKYVIVIDEINRGNVSAIFGELITLIEEDKRFACDNQLILKLPYSKSEFVVPPNLHIIGTMNTADRSVEALDSALRRRFSFTEMLPQPDLIKTAGPLKASHGILNGIDLSVALTTINKRIEKLLDKDHQIGHSYFLQVANIDQLKQAFQSSIIPLLQEYFFGDYGKIGLVLGQGFFAVQEATDDENFFAEFNDYELDGILDKKVYHLIDVTQLDDAPFTELVLAILPRS
jgi:predicted ester cyclase